MTNTPKMNSMSPLSSIKNKQVFFPVGHPNLFFILSMTTVSLSQVLILIVSYPCPWLASNKHLCRCYRVLYRDSTLLQNIAPVAATISGKRESAVRSRTLLC